MCIVHEMIRTQTLLSHTTNHAVNHLSNHSIHNLLRIYRFLGSVMDQTGLTGIVMWCVYVCMCIYRYWVVKEGQTYKVKIMTELCLGIENRNSLSLRRIF